MTVLGYALTGLGGFGTVWGTFGVLDRDTTQADRDLFVIGVVALLAGLAILVRLG